MNVYISGEQLELALMSAAKEDIRYYLNTVHCEFTPTTTRVVTTNGHHMFVMDADPFETNEWSGSFLIPRAVLEQIKPKAQRSGMKLPAQYCITVEPREYRNEISGEVTPLPPFLKIREVADTLTVECVGADGRFPEYQRIIPAPQTQWGEAGCYNADYLMLAMKMYRVANGKRCGALPIRQQGENGVAAVALRARAWFYIMPMRTGTLKWVDVHEQRVFTQSLRDAENKSLEQDANEEK